MGRYAQQSKRGGHQGEQAGLPAGPGPGDFSFNVDAGSVYCQWNGNPIPPYSFYRSRWRVPSLANVWTLSGDQPKPTEDGEFQQSPFPAVNDQQQDCEIQWCTEAGTPQSQWSPYNFIVP